MTTKPTTPKRWRPRFSVRMLLIVVTLVCAYLACWKATIRCGIADVMTVYEGNNSYNYWRHRSRSPLPFVISADIDKRVNGRVMTERTYLVWLIGTYKRIHRRAIPLVPPEDYLPLDHPFLHGEYSTL